MATGRIDLNLLVVFDAIYRERNLTSAGRTLGLSQPAMSHALSRLRHVFRDPLFIRLPRGLQPTSYANELAPSVATGLHTIRNSLQRKEFDPASSHRIFNVGMGDVAEVVQLPTLLAEVRAQAPNVMLCTKQIPGPRLRDALADGAVDVATGDYDLGAGCRGIRLYETEYACVSRVNHSYIGDRLTLKQFIAAEHILVAPDSAFPHANNVERVLRKRTVNARIAVRVSHFHAVLALVTHTDLIAVIPARLALSMKQLANIAVLPTPVPFPKIRVSLYWHERFHREPANAWLRDLFIELLKE
jgi:DNA-binding transcriptional LysR family regulator